MKRFLSVAAIAVALSFVSAGKADAQIVYGYSVPRGGGIMSGGTMYSPGAYGSYNNFYSPYSGMIFNQGTYSNFMGQSFGRGYAYNPWTGMSYNYGFYQPNYWFAPGAGYSYGYFRRW